MSASKCPGHGRHWFTRRVGEPVSHCVRCGAPNPSWSGEVSFPSGMIVGASKKCSHCYEYKPLDAFRRDKSRADGRRAVCNVCLTVLRMESEDAPISVETVKRFWAKVNKNGPVIREELGPCWIWEGATDGRYGKFGVNRRLVKAHRFAYEITYGPLAEGMQACHKCDNEPCCRPDHLFEGDRFSNMQDSADKGRNAMQQHPERSALLRKSHKGENHARHKLTEWQVQEIRRIYAIGGIPYKNIALAFGISAPTIGHIVTRRTWSHVE